MNVFLKQEIADNYDAYYQTEFGKKVDHIEKEIIAELLSKTHSDYKLLDIGCGTGHWTDFFINKGYQVTGIDSSEEMLKIARDKNLSADFIFGDSENLEIEDESYSLITTITMLEFVKNQDKSIKEIYRILKKGGWLIVGGLYADSILGLNKENDEVFKNANLYCKKDLKEIFGQFKLSQHIEGVYLNDKFEFADSHSASPLFFGLLLQKP